MIMLIGTNANSNQEFILGNGYVGKISEFQIFDKFIGYSAAKFLSIFNVQTISIPSTNKNGLYELSSYFSDITLLFIRVNIKHNGSYIGRIALGFYRSLGVAPTREAGFFTTQVQRKTLSGQQIDSAGGYNGRRVSVSLRYKIDGIIFEEIQTAYPYIAKGLPFFIEFTEQEQNWFIWPRFYGTLSDNNFLLQSSVNRLLYSKNLDIWEAF